MGMKPHCGEPTTVSWTTPQDKMRKTDGCRLSARSDAECLCRLHRWCGGRMGHRNAPHRTRFPFPASWSWYLARVKGLARQTQNMMSLQKSAHRRKKTVKIHNERQNQQKFQQTDSRFGKALYENHKLLESNASRSRDLWKLRERFKAGKIQSERH